MYMIFSFSAQTGEVSGDLSYKVSHELVKVKARLTDSQKSEEELDREAHSIHPYVRKAAHMTEYFILAITVAFPFYVYGVRGIWLLLIAGVICVSFAGLDEYHQGFVKGRGPSLKDVLIDSVGVGFGILVVQAFCWSTLHNPDKNRKLKHRKRSGRARSGSKK